jgi:hypothetical protein
MAISQKNSKNFVEKKHYFAINQLYTKLKAKQIANSKSNKSKIKERFI